jgi:hypothetical protein
MKLTFGKGNSRSNARLSGFSAFRRFGVVWFSAFRQCLGYWRSGVLGVLCISVVNLVNPKFSKKEKQQEKERAAVEERGEILRKGKGTRKGKERGAEEERGEAGKKNKLLKDKWREAKG